MPLLFAFGSKRWQELHGRRDLEVIARETWASDYYLLSGPEPNATQLDLRFKILQPQRIVVCCFPYKAMASAVPQDSNLLTFLWVQLD
jgi:hypothetical protein